MMFNENLKKRIGEVLGNDGVIAFVTDTVWGVGCLPESEKAVEKIYRLKHRENSKPLILMSSEFKHLEPYVRTIPQKAGALIEKHFPGALTVVLEKSEKTPLFITSNQNTVGIRVPANKTFRNICECTFNKVLATTSANLSHSPSAKSFEEAKEFVGDFVDLVIDDFNETAQGLESTVILAVNDEIKVLRQGIIKI